MSCIRFNTEAQKEQLKIASFSNEAIAQWLSPELTDSKLERIRLMAKDKNAKIRESAALSYHIPEDVAWKLAKDKTASVRMCLARNEHTPCDVLRLLAKDKNADVRKWVAVNFFAPLDAMEKLKQDVDSEVRKLVEWKLQLANPSIEHKIT